MEAYYVMTYGAKSGSLPLLPPLFENNEAGGDFLATTRLMPLHTGKGRNLSTAIADIIDYVKNPQKTDFGKFIYGYECDTRIADAEFLLSKRQYASLTGRNRGSDDVIAYHLRQAFKPGEVTPEEANQIGRELAMKLTK